MPIDVVIASDLQTAVAVEKVEQGGNPRSAIFGYPIHLWLRTAPKQELTRLLVIIDDIFQRQLERKAAEMSLDVETLLEQIALGALARHLDATGPPPLVGPLEKAATISAGDEAQSYFEPLERVLMDDAELLKYMAAKVYWGWRYGMRQVALSLTDTRRFGVSFEEFRRLGLAGDGTYWSRTDPSSLTLTPTARLLRDFPDGAFPGMDRPLVHRVADRLAAPRYEAARQHFSKAMDFLNGDVPDEANAVKEATAAVEALTLRVLNKDSGTLGDGIKELRTRGLLAPPLAKALEGLWGYSSEEPGVRHGKVTAPAPKAHEATFAINVAASAVLLLLELDL